MCIKTVQKLKESFTSPEQAIDMVKKMCALGSAIIDGAKPVQDSYIFKGVRISAMIAPIVDDEIGATASIRRQKKNAITRKQLLEYGTATADELDFLDLCLNCGVSVAVGGSTGSGKTTDIGYLLRNVSHDKRIYTIEDSRELDLKMYDEDGHCLNRIINTKTRVTDDPKTSITADMLLKQALRQDPDIIVPAEMRGVEAWTAQEAGRTGHTIVTTLHTNSAAEAYKRILTMCQEKEMNLSEDLVMSMIMDAFPIVVFKKQLIDGSRKYMQIIEPTAYVNGDLKYNVLFEFVTTGWKTNPDGSKEVEGEHRRVKPLSDKLAVRMMQNGATTENIRRFTNPNWEPSKIA